MRVFLTLCAIALISCKLEKTSKQKEKADSDSTKVVQVKHDNGRVKAEIPYKNGKQHGLSRSFDRNGNLILELPYNNNKREGVAKKYYAGGKQLYQVTEYKDDKINGTQTKYREDGKVMSVAQYENNSPCLGLKEYLLDGSPKKKYPHIVITPVDLLGSQGLFKLQISMSEKVRSVKYYSGKLTSSGCLDDNSYFILLKSKSIGELKFNLPPGGFMMEEINIIAVVETTLGNSYITQKVYNLAIDN